MTESTHDSGAPDVRSGRFATIAWATVGVLIAINLSVGLRVGSTPPGSGDAYAFGYRIGTALAPLLLALAVAFVVGLVRRDVRSAIKNRWLPILAMAFLIAATVQMLAAAGRRAALIPPPADAALSLRISAPYQLTAADEETTTLLWDSLLQGGDEVRSAEVRLIEDDGVVIGILVTTDMALAGDQATFDEFIVGAGDGAGVPGNATSIGGRDVGIYRTPAGVFVAWIESPLALMVVAPDEPTARTLTEAVLGATP